MEGIWETGLTVYYLYPKRFDSLTTCGCNCNGSTFSSVECWSNPSRTPAWKPSAQPTEPPVCGVSRARLDNFSLFLFAKKVGYQGDTFPSGRPVLEINLDSNLFLSEQTWLREWKFPWANQVVCSSWGTSVEERVALTGSGKGGPDPAFPPLFRENPASRSFFINFPNPAFLSQKNTLKSLISTKANKC